ncbi:MBL fold metallo-hydrolase [Sneathiella glossodoripedis]|uniref:MBL fold metallo-hydrolase n=1 Tax=Sneathiella glossodoripedis TaxID=418853 RepID=UPI000470F440|nr:MBL fold metallo-hydrolase [Sneathiella glossodoripedis]
MNVWQIGNVKVTRVVEIEMVGGTRFILPDAAPDKVLPIKWLYPHFMNEKGKLIMSVHALVIDTGERRIIVDTCIGNDKEREIAGWNNLQTTFLDDLEAAGYAPADIDTVLCTHLHVDHVGWNTRLVDGKWVPTFPNARYLYAKSEWDHWASGDGDKYGEAYEDSVKPIFDLGLADLVDCNEQICDEVSLVPTPGHTPGHVSVRISSEGKEAFITGDALHHPCQMARLDWAASADADPEQARQTRRDMLSSLADSDTLVFGTHFATPSAGHVVSDSDGTFRLEVSRQSGDDFSVK